MRDQAPPAQGGLDRRDLLRLGGLLGVLLAITAAVVVLGGGGGGDTGERRTVQGVITEVDETRLVLRPDGGGAARELVIRPQDLRRLDLLHLREHSSQRLPSIVHYETGDGEEFVVRVDDGPVGP